MARTSSLLASTTPSVIAPADVTIGHVQLRDLIICPREAGIVNYVHKNSIIEHDLHTPDLAPRPIADLAFVPNTLSSLNLSDSPHTLLAAGGQDTEIHLSLHSPSRTRPLWQFSRKLSGSINNSVLLARAFNSSHEPRLIVSNNDWTVRLYDVPLRRPQDLRCCGTLRLEEPVNHSSISPDGRTLLSVGDSPRIYLHSLSGSARLSFNRVTTLQIPPPVSLHPISLVASFSTAWSADGLKFAVACQEGVIAIWDVRSTKPLKVLYTSRERGGGDSGWMSDDPWDWTRGASRAPGWGARSVKFGCGGVGGRAGHEVMTYTEHTNLLHVLDARTFETEEIIHVPNFSCSKTNSAHTPAPPSLRHSGGRLSTRAARRDDGIVVIPLHGALPRTTSWTSAPPSRMSDRTGGGDEGDTMDLDELEVDCLSRGGSPPPINSYRPPSPYRPISPSPLSSQIYRPASPPYRPVSPPYRPMTPSFHPYRRTPRRTHGEEGEVERVGNVAENEDMDIAGTCFDPTGGFLYVATTAGVAEWTVHGSEKRWWGSGQWA
ncbi:WD40-repeat-containing domain protein [Suillus clintonianus]|uniref:WD40-repeat-containing domain protein n=1 Tax=Suillus clintonianus TaxID=1904413 RepID=UPI001B875426|nr:WD40-repeat-containing domain protein [Suillus clintonianus]KAG2131376.1 WD40-repeat-containing domain protein [Suillus clintonianus]